MTDELDILKVEVKARFDSRPAADLLNGVYTLDRYGAAEMEFEETSWFPLDLTAATQGADVDPPSLFYRSDGLCLLYTGRIHAFQGESESLKSWAALLAAAQAVASGKDVLHLDFEDDERGVVARLFALGVTSEQILDHIVYMRPDEPLRDRGGYMTRGGTALYDLLASRSFALAIVDGVTEAMTTEGLELNSNTDVATWMRRLARPIARSGAAVVVLDHLPKRRVDQGRHALGGQHKLAGLTGAAYTFTTVSYLSRASDSLPVEGRVLITVEKDRPGYVRGRSIGNNHRVGELRVISFPDGHVTASVEPPVEGTPVDPRLAARILQHLANNGGSSQNTIEKTVGGKSVAVRTALASMTDPERAWVRVERKGTGHLHWLTDAGREELARDEGRGS